MLEHWCDACSYLTCCRCRRNGSTSVMWLQPPTPGLESSFYLPLLSSGFEQLLPSYVIRMDAVRHSTGHPPLRIPIPLPAGSISELRHPTKVAQVPSKTLLMVPQRESCCSQLMHVRTTQT